MDACIWRDKCNAGTLRGSATLRGDVACTAKLQCAMLCPAQQGCPPHAPLGTPARVRLRRPVCIHDVGSPHDVGQGSVLQVHAVLLLQTLHMALGGGGAVQRGAPHGLGVPVVPQLWGADATYSKAPSAKGLDVYVCAWGGGVGCRQSLCVTEEAIETATATATAAVAARAPSLWQCPRRPTWFYQPWGGSHRPRTPVDACPTGRKTPCRGHPHASSLPAGPSSCWTALAGTSTLAGK